LIGAIAPGVAIGQWHGVTDHGSSVRSLME
jgi:hypothetical protein